MLASQIERTTRVRSLPFAHQDDRANPCLYAHQPRIPPKASHCKVHGGAGALDNLSDEHTAVRYLESIRVVLEPGREVLAHGATAVEAVEACASLRGDDPLFNAGCGSS